MTNASAVDLIDLPDRIRQIAQQSPDRAALISVARKPWGSKTVKTSTFKTISDRSERLAVGLKKIGVGEGTLCSYMVPPGEDAMVIALALWRVGAVMVGIEPYSHGLRPISKSLARVGPTVFFGPAEAQAAQLAFGWGRGTVKTRIVIDSQKLPGSRGPVSLLPGVHSLAKLEENAAPENPQTVEVGADAPMLIGYTTGSTGNPKPMVMTKQNVSAMINGVMAQWQLGSGEEIVDMPTFPIFWIIGLSHGGTTIVPPMDFALHGPGDAKPEWIADAIVSQNVHSMFASPALLTNLVEYCAKEGMTLPSIKRIVSGGAEIQGPLYAAMKPVIPNGELYSNYGATEALPVAEIDGETVLGETWALSEQGRGLCVGFPLPGVEARIIEIDDDDIATIDDARELPTGEIGELIVRSPHVSDHYYNAPEDMAANKIEDGDTRWQRLGDTAYLDEQGRIWVCGRRSHRVVSGDGLWFALPCEFVFNTHPDVLRTALIGPTRGGEVVPTICVELLPGARSSRSEVEADLRKMAEEHDSTRGIENFIFLDKLPVDKRHNAKIDRPELARQASAGKIH
jgi:acyl-CoA synthetase (AMP-forming)/AMP-acid ligase II